MSKKFCFLEEQEHTNKSIFNYVVDPSMYVNKNECNNYTAPFLTYIPSGTPVKNVDLENELKGMTRPYSKCTSCKYQPEQYTLTQTEHQELLKQKQFNAMPNNKKECSPEYNIISNGYLYKK